MDEKEILIVDDDRVTSLFVSKGLEKKGFKVHLVSSGPECLEYLEENIPAVVLLDIIMPEMDGLEVLEKIHENFPSVELPVIMVSAKEDDKDIIQALKLGANDYITKPVRFDVAIARIRMQAELADLHKESQQASEVKALNAMMVTFRHEMNSPLFVAKAFSEQLSSENRKAEKIQQALEKIEAILQKMDNAVSSGLKYVQYSDDVQMLCLKKTK